MTKLKSSLEVKQSTDYYEYSRTCTSSRLEHASVQPYRDAQVSSHSPRADSSPGAGGGPPAKGATRRSGVHTHTPIPKSRTRGLGLQTTRVRSGPPFRGRIIKQRGASDPREGAATAREEEEGWRGRRSLRCGRGLREGSGRGEVGGGGDEARGRSSGRGCGRRAGPGPPRRPSSARG